VHAKVTLEPTAADCDPDSFGWFTVATAHLEVQSDCKLSGTGLAGDSESFDLTVCCDCDDNDPITDITPLVEIRHRVAVSGTTTPVNRLRGAGSSTCTMTKDGFSCSPQAGSCQ